MPAPLDACSVRCTRVRRSAESPPSREAKGLAVMHTYSEVGDICLSFS